MNLLGRIFFLCSLAILLPATLLASEISIRPFLIDVELEPRETYEEVITLRNDYPTRKSVLYATVNEITVDNIGEIREFVSPVMTDRTNTVTSWIEIGRGRIELMPGDSVDVPLTIRTHPNAEPGEYHVFVGLVEAAKRPVAEAIALNGDADGVIVKITIADQRKDSMKIVSFLVDRFITRDKNKVVDIQLENQGDLPSTPTGEIIFYDSRGVEVDNVPVNVEGVVIQPGESTTIQAPVPLSDTLGRYKANVTLSYGENQKASLYDTTYFYMMPFNLLLVLLAAIVVISLLITMLFKRALVTQDYDEMGDDVIMYVKDGHEPSPKDHDIDLSNNQK